MKEVLYEVGKFIIISLGFILALIGLVYFVDLAITSPASIEIVGEEKLIHVGDYVTIPKGKEVTFVCVRGSQIVQGDWIFSGDISVNLTEIKISEGIVLNAISIIPRKKDGVARISFLQRTANRVWMRVANTHIRTV